MSLDGTAAKNPVNVHSTPPTTVRLASMLLFAAFSLGFLMQCIRMYHRYHLASTAGGFPLLAIIFAGVGLMFLLLVAAMAKALIAGRNWARIVFLVFVLFRLLTSVPHIAVEFRTVPMFGAIGSARSAMELLAVILLFSASSAAWFRKNNKPH